MRLGFGLALAALLWAPLACKHKKPAVATVIVQEASRVPMTVQIGDPRAAGQLVSGFYDIEGGAWRWTGKRFIVELGTPIGSATRGATLELHFTLPPVVIEKNQSVTVTASVDGNLLPPQTYTTAGEAVYKQDVPGSLLASDAVKVSFELDKTMSPGGADERQLGVIATSAGFIRK